MRFPFSRLIRILAITAGLLACTAASALAATVTISSPASGATMPAPIKVVASATSSHPVTLMQIYLDGVKVYQISGASVSTSISASTGQHRLTVQAYDSSNYVFKSTIYVTVGTTTKTTSTSSSSSTSTATTTAPAGATTYANIENLAGWASCSTCAGPGGAGSVAPYRMTQATSPSLDGSSANFWLGGSTPYSNALWWKQLGANSGVSHFQYDVWFYLKNSAAPQALEFDVNQTINGYQYVFGTQCNVKGDHTWDVWDYYKHWVSTGVPCSAPAAYTWHHLTWQFERASGKMHFISVTLDGSTHYVNQYHSPKPKSTNELNVAFQMDGNGSMTNYNVWLDKVSLKAW
jgi:hypothetical protein